MKYRIIKKLPPIEDIIQALPLPQLIHQKILQDRQEVKNILAGHDPRLLMIVGPCSAWPKPAVLEYAEKLARLNETVQTQLKLVMRVYTQKPRTSKGWTGPANQPDPSAYPDIATGIHYARETMLKVLATGLPIADEAVLTHQSTGFLELLSWAAIGARSTESQEHRVFASAIDCAVGMKNPTHGSLAVGVNSLLAAQASHVAVFNDYEVETQGNEHAHLVLRGSRSGPNYTIEHLREVQRLMGHHPIKNPAVLIDASHDNCLLNGKKDYRLQPQVITEVMMSLGQFPELRPLIKGFMLESFLKPGNQGITLPHSAAIDLSGLSITDGCLGWESTEELLLNLADRVAAYA